MRRAVILLAAAAVSVLAGGWLIAVTWHISYGHGLYCSLGTASTVGCDRSAPGPAGWIAAGAVILVAVPLLAAAYSQLHLDRIRTHVDRRLREHLGSKDGSEEERP